MAGLTDQGFTPKTDEEISKDIGDRLKAYFGDDINLEPGSRWATLVDIFSSELSDCWLGLQADYNSRFRATASGMNLDLVGTLTNTRRRAETASSASCYMGGPNPGVILPANLRVQVTGGSRLFYSDTTATITDSDYLIICDSLPTRGNIKLQWGVSPIATIPAGATEEEIVEALTLALTSSGVQSGDISVSGTLGNNGAIHINFNANSPLVELVITENTLLRFNSEVQAESCYSTANLESFTGINSTNEAIPARSITTVASSSLAFTKVINFQAGNPGLAREADGDYRKRMENRMGRPGTATQLGYLQALENVTGVSSVGIEPNLTDLVDSSGRPPHSIEVYVDGGSDDLVAQTIYDLAPLGIPVVNSSTAGTTSSRTGNVLTENGRIITLDYSSSTDLAIRIKVVAGVSPSFPGDGVDQIKNALVAAIGELQIAEVLKVYELYTPIRVVEGILTPVITVQVATADYSADNVIPNKYERITVSPSNITVEYTING